MSELVILFGEEGELVILFGEESGAPVAEHEPTTASIENTRPTPSPEDVSRHQAAQRVAKKVGEDLVRNDVTVSWLVDAIRFHQVPVEDLLCTVVQSLARRNAHLTKALLEAMDRSPLPIVIKNTSRAIADGSLWRDK